MKSVVSCASGLDDAIRPAIKIVFWDLYANTEDVSNWSGISAMTIQGLRRAGAEVSSAGYVLPLVRKLTSSAFWHYYAKYRQLHYIPDRHMVLAKVFSWYGNYKVKTQLKKADAVVTTSTSATAFLATEKPIFVIHDATWAQVLELYPYFAASKQVPRVVSDGFEMEKRTFTRSNVTLILASAWAAERAILDYHLDRERVHVLPLGANFEEDPPRHEVERAIQDRKGDHCNLLFVGREFDRKGGHIAVDAAAALRDLGIPTTLHVVGCSPVGLPAFVSIHGLLRKDRKAEVKQLTNLYSRCDFFILPTQAEAQGIVFNEAAAYGLPVVATNVGGVSSVVKNGGWGLLLPSDAPGQHYASWIAELFRDRVRYLSTALSAREDYEARLSRSVHSGRLLAIIDQVVKGSGHGSKTVTALSK